MRALRHCEHCEHDIMSSQTHDTNSVRPESIASEVVDLEGQITTCRKTILSQGHKAEDRSNVAT
jgi:hypothetical protein